MILCDCWEEEKLLIVMNFDVLLMNEMGFNNIILRDGFFFKFWYDIF